MHIFRYDLMTLSLYIFLFLFLSNFFLCIVCLHSLHFPQHVSSTFSYSTVHMMFSVSSMMSSSRTALPSLITAPRWESPQKIRWAFLQFKLLSPRPEMSISCTCRTSQARVITGDRRKQARPETCTDGGNLLIAAGTSLRAESHVTWKGICDCVRGDSVRSHN